MFILDQIHFPTHTVDHIIGGAGTYAILGARLFSPPPLSQTLGWIVDAGTDFPAATLATLSQLSTRLLLRRSTARATTRGWNAYGPGDHRAFRYLTPKRRLTADDLSASGLSRARCTHIICSPARAAELLPALGPLVVWEPVPDACTPAQLPALLAAARGVAVVSPNAEELRSVFGAPDAPLEALAGRLLDAGAGAVVVRAGARGCLVATPRLRRWLPAVHTDAARVVDPTGGGNTFVGALGVALARGVDVVRAAAMGNVAASFAIEQVGLPALGAGETWNGASVFARLQEYLRALE